MPGLDSAEGSKLLSSARALEINLNEKIKQVGLLDKEVGLIRNQTREAYKKLLLTAFHLALENDAEAVIWKDTYRVIEDYRGKLSSMYKKGASNTADESAPIIKDFNAFLNEATSFYLELVKELDKTFGVDISTQIKQQNDPLFGLNLEAKTLKLKNVELRCLLKTYQKTVIFLGDLARYQELLNVEKPKREFEVAHSFYKNAINILHTTGNPYNQLAVISAYKENDISVIYYYYRSLVISTPFPNSLGNLDTKMGKLLKTGTGLQDIPTNTPALELFTKYFLYSHAVLFKGQELEAFLTFKPTVVKTFKALIRNRELTLEQNLMITSINLASFEYLKYFTKDSPEKNLYERNAVIFAIDMFKAYLENGIEALDKLSFNRRRQEFVYESLPGGLKRTLPSLYIYTLWAKSNIEAVRNALSSAGTLEELGGELCHDSFWRKFKEFSQSLRRVKKKIKLQPSPTVLDEEIEFCGQLFGNIPFNIPSRFLLASFADASRETKSCWRIHRLLIASTHITRITGQDSKTVFSKEKEVTKAETEDEELVQPNEKEASSESVSDEEVFTFRGRQQPKASLGSSPKQDLSSPLAQSSPEVASTKMNAPDDTSFGTGVFMEPEEVTQIPFHSTAEQYVNSLVEDETTYNGSSHPEDEVSFNPYSSLSLPPLFSQPSPFTQPAPLPFSMASQPLFQPQPPTFTTHNSGFLSRFDKDIWAPLGQMNYSHSTTEEQLMFIDPQIEKNRRVSESNFFAGYPQMQTGPRHSFSSSRPPPPGFAPVSASPFSFSQGTKAISSEENRFHRALGSYSDFLGR
ncbi:hypothetical protein DSO57_1015681 [Entomophthora muscae]|uniref:Uncharacterized protein n=2 Tax=Entomophthora muscae TaxID=34485 RepID=A0ACC2RDQ9_9FUNG|nr:hypothetical protein DSO57_1037455 [Entomophthora muscae]KAJ9089171.1 hypothetical protein DSO57_1015681 [Entomophthora muscae]